MKFYYESIAEVPELKPVIEKLEQVRRWNEKLERSIKNYIESQPLILKSKQEGEFTQYYVDSFQQPPREISDFATASFSSARSLLNFCAQVLADSPVTAKQAPINRRAIQFPVASEKAAYIREVNRGRLGIPKEETIERIRLIQPFSDISQLFGDNSKNSEEKIDPTKHFLHEIQLASNNEKHYSDPAIVTTVSPDFPYEAHPDAGIWPGRKVEIVYGAKLHKTRHVGPIAPEFWKLDFSVIFKDLGGLKPLLGWVHSYEWFLRYIFLPHVFEDLACDFYKGKKSVTTSRFESE